LFDPTCKHYHHEVDNIHYGHNKWRACIFKYLSFRHYFLASEKIGHTNDMNRRFQELQRTIAGELEVVSHMLVDGNVALEHCVLSLIQKALV